MNAKEELLHKLESCNARIKCADITVGDDWDNDRKKITLREGYTDLEFRQFLQLMDFEYHDGFGRQALFGIVWLDNDEWLQRGEYDGSEWWDHMSLPEIPDNLKQNSLVREFCEKLRKSF